MTESDISKRIKAIIIHNLNVEEEQLTNDTKFTDLGADSLDVVELIMNIEKEFQIAIPDNEAEKLNTVGKAISYVELHLN